MIRRLAVVACAAGLAGCGSKIHSIREPALKSWGVAVVAVLSGLAATWVVLRARPRAPADAARS